jgi:hypothetical protein
MIARISLTFGIATAALLFSACGGSNNSTPSVASAPGTVQLRFLEGSPSLEALVNGEPTDIGLAYLTVNGATIASSFTYAYLTTFSSFPAGVQSLEALDSLGYKVGPVKTSALAAGKQYTIVLVGSYPNYKALAFEEPAPESHVSLSAYEASPAVPQIDFGSFHASGKPQYARLGSVSLGNVATVAIGDRVTNFGGYFGHGTVPIVCGTTKCGAVTAQQVNPFDRSSALPFHAASRLSLFVIDAKPGESVGPVVGSLDQ